jgi:hypothetical protein
MTNTTQRADLIAEGFTADFLDMTDEQFDAMEAAQPAPISWDEYLNRMALSPQAKASLRLAEIMREADEIEQRSTDDAPLAQLREDAARLEVLLVEITEVEAVLAA